MTYEDIMKFVKFMVKTSITFKLIFTKVTKSWEKKENFHQFHGVWSSMNSDDTKIECSGLY